MISIHKKNWGTEEWITNTNKYCMKLLNINPKHVCSLHHHKIKHETFYVDYGVVVMTIGDSNAIATEGDTFVIEPGVNHRFMAIESARIIEVSTEHFEDDSYRIARSGVEDDDTFCYWINKYAERFLTNES